MRVGGLTGWQDVSDAQGENVVLSPLTEAIEQGRVFRRAKR